MKADPKYVFETIYCCGVKTPRATALVVEGIATRLIPAGH